MKRKKTFYLGLLVSTVLILYMVTFQVSFHESAVVTTFGRADANSVHHGDGKGVLGNLSWKWPWPIQKVRYYDRRVQVLDDRLEEQQTLDKQGVIVSAHVAWRIVDPLAFFRSFGNVADAERQIISLLRDARSEVGNYSFEELTTRDRSKLKLDDVETAIGNKLNAALDRQKKEGQSWGIQIELVGIRQLLLPEVVTERVFERMRATRQRLAESARSEGERIAKDLESEAISDRETILSFVNRRAQEIRAEGDKEAAIHYDVFKKNEEFAVFLRKLDTYSSALNESTTFILDANQGIFRELFESGQALKKNESTKSDGPQNNSNP